MRIAGEGQGRFFRVPNKESVWLAIKKQNRDGNLFHPTSRLVAKRQSSAGACRRPPYNVRAIERTSPFAVAA